MIGSKFQKLQLAFSFVKCQLQLTANTHWITDIKVWGENEDDQKTVDQNPGNNNNKCKQKWFFFNVLAIFF